MTFNPQVNGPQSEFIQHYDEQNLPNIDIIHNFSHMLDDSEEKDD
jgi:hypothetical protein